jgi:peptide methionine sulfoxide reductase MsrB
MIMEESMGHKTPKRIIKLNDEWRKTLEKEELEMCRNQATEKPSSGKHNRL